MEETTPEPAANLQAGPVVMQAVIHVTRAATGKTETYTITGTALDEEKKEP